MGFTLNSYQSGRNSIGSVQGPITGESQGYLVVKKRLNSFKPKKFVPLLIRGDMEGFKYLSCGQVISYEWEGKFAEFSRKKSLVFSH